MSKGPVHQDSAAAREDLSVQEGQQSKGGFGCSSGAPSQISEVPWEGLLTIQIVCSHGPVIGPASGLNLHESSKIKQGAAG